MAAVNYTELDKALAQDVYQFDNSAGNAVAAALEKALTFTDKFKVLQSAYQTYAAKNPTKARTYLDAASNWLKANSGDLVDDSTNTYLSDGVYKAAIEEKGLNKKPGQTGFTKINDLRKSTVSDGLSKEVDPSSMSPSAFDKLVSDTIDGNTITPYKPSNYIKYATLGTPPIAYTPNKGITADQLKATYGGLIDPKTQKPVFTDQQFQDVVSGAIPASIFNTKVKNIATAGVNKVQDWSLYGGATGTQFKKAVNNAITNPSTLPAAYNLTSKQTADTVTGGVKTDTVPGGVKTDTVPGITNLLKTWHAPKQNIATANSPYSGLLDATLAKVTGAPFGTPTNNAVYKNLTDPLTQGTGLDSLVKPKLTYDTTNTAGITGLGDVKGTLQSLNTQVTSPPSYNQNSIANAALANQQVEKDRLVAEKLAAEKLAKEKLAAELKAFNPAHPAQYEQNSAAYYNGYLTPQVRNLLTTTGTGANDPKTNAALQHQIELSTAYEQSPYFANTYGMSFDDWKNVSAKNAFSVNPIKPTNTNPIVTPVATNTATSQLPAYFQGMPTDFYSAINTPNYSGLTDAQKLAKYNGGNPTPVVTSNPPANQGIASNVNNITSPGFMNTSATGPNGQSGIVSVLPQPINTITLGALSPEQLQAQQQTAAQAMQQQVQPVTSTGSIRLG